VAYFYTGRWSTSFPAFTAVLVEALVTAPLLLPEVVFSWATPGLIRPILLALRTSIDRPYLYRAAMASVPPTPATSAWLRHNLHDHTPEVLHAAIELCGLRRDADAVSQLIDLLDIDDNDTRIAVIMALTRMGRSITHRLANVAQDASRDDRSRSGALAVLQAIGWRTPGVSTAIGACLRDGRERTDLMRAALLAAAKLRDAEHRHVAQYQVRNPDVGTALAAAQLLILMPKEYATPGINQAINEWRRREDIPFRGRVLERLYQALAKCGGSAAQDHLLNEIQAALAQ